jgi:predicted DNA-binding transcriptional regulator AlpA
MARKMSENLSISVGEICSTLKISRATYYRFLKIEGEFDNSGAGASDG